MAEELMRVPASMDPWKLGELKKPIPTAQGKHWALVGCEPSRKEQHHQVRVWDENGNPAQDVVVFFGFGMGNGVDYDPVLDAQPNAWHGGPAELNGNAVKTINGYAEHTFASGGEDIFIWDLEADGSLNNPSDILYACKWINTGGQPFGSNHQGVLLTFQLLPWKEGRR